MNSCQINKLEIGIFKITLGWGGWVGKPQGKDAPTATLPQCKMLQSPWEKPNKKENRTENKDTKVLQTKFQMFMVFPLPLWALDKIYLNFHQIKEISLFKEILQKKKKIFSHHPCCWMQHLHLLQNGGSIISDGHITISTLDL